MPKKKKKKKSNTNKTKEVKETQIIKNNNNNNDDDDNTSKTSKTTTGSFKEGSIIKFDELLWKPVQVELERPGGGGGGGKGAGGDKDDQEDYNEGEDINHYDQDSKLISQAENDLEVEPGESIGFFYGLEVLTVLPPDLLKKSQTNRKRKLPQEEDKNENDENENENDNDNAGNKKKKKKKKKAKKKKATPDKQEETNENEDQNKPNIEKGKNNDGKMVVVEKEQKGNKKGNEQKSVQEVNDKNEEEMAALRDRWMNSTGGVVLDDRLCSRLQEQGFTNPTPIQRLALPPAILGYRNIVGSAPTGSGKTLAFLLPIYQHLFTTLSKNTENTVPSLPLQALILAPTRELAMQIQKECIKLEPPPETKNRSYFSSGLIVGGLDSNKQTRVLKKKRPPIIVGTPGRLWDMLSSGEHPHLNDLSQLRFLVIDEADRMIQQGSFPQLKKILEKMHAANPMIGVDDEESDEEESSSDEDDDEDRMRGVGGIRGEAKLQMLTPEMLQRMEEIHSGKGDGKKKNTPMKSNEKSNSEEEDVYADEDDPSQSSNTESPSVFRQTFIFSATLTLSASESYLPSMDTKKSKNKMRQRSQSNLESMQEIIYETRMKGQIKIIDLSKQGEEEEEYEQQGNFPATKKAKRSRQFNLPPGLSLHEIKCTQKHKDAHLYGYLMSKNTSNNDGPCLVFCNSIYNVKRIGSTLQQLFGQNSKNVSVLHASMQQKARFKVIELLSKAGTASKSKKKRQIVVATDVAARGLDIPSISTVIHYDVARTVDGFVHRAGRTARGVGEGAVGCSVSLVSSIEDQAHNRIIDALSGSDANRLMRDELFRTIVLDGRFLTACIERMNLASKIISVAVVQRKNQQDRDWFHKQADEAGLILDDDEIDDNLFGTGRHKQKKVTKKGLNSNTKEQQQILEAERAKHRLAQLLKEPLTKVITSKKSRR